MSRLSIKEFAKNKVKENFLLIMFTSIVGVILPNLEFMTEQFNGKYFYTVYYYFGWIFYFVEVGFAFFLVKFIKNEKCSFKDIFSFYPDFMRCIYAILLQIIIIALNLLLFIIPGIIKLFSYALVPYLLADSKYQDMKLTDILKKSKEMMNGHKMDFFILNLSFIAWHLLAIPTLGLIEIWIIPYQSVSNAKFLVDIKEKNEKVNDSETKTALYCSECGSKIGKNSKYCAKCGKKI